MEQAIRADHASLYLVDQRANELYVQVSRLRSDALEETNPESPHPESPQTAAAIAEQLAMLSSSE
eukprot:3855072-Amphidinium_carterae.1